MGCMACAVSVLFLEHPEDRDMFTLLTKGGAISLVLWLILGAALAVVDTLFPT